MSWEREKRSLKDNASMALIIGLQRLSLLILKYILKNWLTKYSRPQRFVQSSPVRLSDVSIPFRHGCCYFLLSIFSLTLNSISILKHRTRKIADRLVCKVRFKYSMHPLNVWVPFLETCSLRDISLCELLIKSEKMGSVLDLKIFTSYSAW